jgi:hypothetical protein
MDKVTRELLMETAALRVRPMDERQVLDKTHPYAHSDFDIVAHHQDDDSVHDQHYTVHHVPSRSEVQVYGPRKAFGGQVQAPEINWSAHGGRGADHAERYAKMILHGVKIARELSQYAPGHAAEKD